MKKNSKVKISDKTVMIISVTLALLTCLSFVFVVAEFTKSTRAKRVLATDEGGGMLFSSNYLTANSTLTGPVVNQKVYRRKIYSSEAGQAASGVITLCNYSQGNPTKIFESNITYTLTAKLVVLSEGANGAAKRDATAADLTGETVTLSLNDGTEITLSSSNLSYTYEPNTLSGLGPSTHNLSVDFSADFNDANSNLALYICATPAGVASSLYPIDGAFTTGVSTTKATWKGSFNENTEEAGVTPGQPYYDGFNYEITGSGKGTFTLWWDESKLQINQIFLDEENLTPAANTPEAGWKQITINVNSDIKDRYDLQFYYANGVSALISWDNLSDAVDWNYVETVETPANP